MLIAQGADARAAISPAGETPLHSALSKAGRPAHNYVVRLLLEHGASWGNGMDRNFLGKYLRES